MGNGRLKVLFVNGSGPVGGRLIEKLGGTESLELLAPAIDADEARRAFRSGAPDLVLLGPQLPAGTRLALLDEAKETRPSVRVIVLAMATDEQYRRAWLGAGADDCIGISGGLRALLYRILDENPANGGDG